MWGKGKKSGVATSRSSHSTESFGVVVSHVAPSSFSKVKSFLKGKRARYCILVLLLVAAVCAVAWFYANDQKKQNTVEDNDGYLLSREDYGKIRSEELLKNRPDASASKESKNLYYSELMQEQYNTRDFRGATSTYKAAVDDLGADTVLYGIHLVATKAYLEIGDKNSARTTLAKARSTVAQSAEDPVLREGREKELNNIEAEINK